MKTSIIIPVFNKMAYTKKCLDSVFKFGSKYDFEIIVINNASSDNTKEYLDGLKDKIKSIHNDKNLGFAKACNQGAAKAKGKYILFLNNDTIVTKYWMDALIAELDKNPKTAIAGSKLLFPNRTIQHAGVVFKEDKTPFHIYYKESSDKHYLNIKRNFKAVTAACMIIRKEVFNRVKGLNETYINGLEDIDLCLKVGAIGLNIIYCPTSVVYHLESVSEDRFKYNKKNEDYFLKKWGNIIIPDEKKYLSKDGNLKKNDELEFIIKKQKDDILKLSDTIQQIEQELFFIKSSKLWKLRDLHLKFKFLLFSPGKFIKKYFNDKR